MDLDEWQNPVCNHTLLNSCQQELEEEPASRVGLEAGCTQAAGEETDPHCDCGEVRFNHPMMLQ